jgi:hypothetical protein
MRRFSYAIDGDAILAGPHPEPVEGRATPMQGVPGVNLAWLAIP